MNGWILTGSIATGKSTVASLLRLYGYKVISADEVAKIIREQNRDKIIELFNTDKKEESRQSRPEKIISIRYLK
jgi:dephospho-CoA kinase